jgi:RND family efflux transporter MFP subunit
MSELLHRASGESTEEQLRAEIEELKRKLDARDQGHGHSHSHKPGKPSGTTLWTLAILAAVALIGLFFAGYLPQSNKQTALAKEAKDDSAALPIVNVTPVQVSSGKSNLVLSGSIQAVTEAPVLARQSGYIKKRYVDIGDRVTQGQILAEIDAAELGQQVEQAKASREQAKSALEQATANLEQGKTNADMAKITAERWKSLVQKGAVARQDADTYQSQYDSQRMSVQALEKAVAAAKSNIAVTEANLARLGEVESYLTVRAPFAGVITQRNIDTGALVNEGSTLMFRIAQIDRVRAYISVPQADATAVKVGQTASLRIPDLPSEKFTGTVTRTANSLDPNTRTLLAEVQVANGDGKLLPGMYAEVSFTTPRAEPPMVIRGDTLVLRADGPQVAVIDDNNVAHYQKVELGRDYGDRIEVVAGLKPGQKLVINPGDAVRNGGKVKPILLAKKDQ